ncbi:multidrug ABC transporter ATP-binding protein [Candidatus Magnetomorum sp. HK-1]|nr:multidrug ABC transporter ATP-binding protein [Candidatus Magnetomorum sp. HK-1]
MKTSTRFYNRIIPYWPMVVFIFLSVLVITICSVLSMPLLQNLVESIGSKDISRLFFWIGASLAVYIVRSIAAYAQIMLSYGFILRVVSDLRRDSFQHIQTLSLHFYDKHKSGEILSNMTSEIQTIQTTLADFFIRTLRHLLTPIGITVYLLYLNYRLILIIMVAIFILIRILKKSRSIMLTASRQVSESYAHIESFLQENIRGIKVIKGFTLENTRFQKFKDIIAENSTIIKKESRVIAVQDPLAFLVHVIAALFVLGVSSYFIIDGSMTSAELITFLLGVFLFIDPVREISRFNVYFQRILASAERIFALLDIKTSIIDSPSASVIHRDKVMGKLSFQDVHFQYDKDRPPVLTKINLTINPSEIIALKGKSGTGKTTLLNMIPRFYDPTKGVLLLDDHDISNYTLASLRSVVGIVPQETILFSGTLRENIRIGNPEATTAQIEEAARLANIHDFVMEQPEKYETSIGENGVLLSEGERQRLSIARCFLKNPKILLLDEITSSLDIDTEKLILESLINLINNRTTIIISHKPSLLNLAQRMVVMENGKIVKG